MPRSSSSRLTTHTDLRGYFDQGVRSALDKQRVDADDHTRVYLVNLLTHFADSRNLFDHTEEGLRMRALAEHYADAHYAEHPRERAMALRRLGDVALFIASVFGDSLQRRSVDLDYYVAMGGTAYGELAQCDRAPSVLQAAHQVFAQLAERFVLFMDVLTEVARPSQSECDVLRLYETWLRTGSPRAKRQLQALGITPAAFGQSLRQQ